MPKELLLFFSILSSLFSTLDLVPSIFEATSLYGDCLCGLVVRVLGYRSRHCQIFWGKKEKKKKTVMGLERGPLSLVSTTEELLDRKVAAPV
jgi:hypothetical protein